MINKYYLIAASCLVSSLILSWPQKVMAQEKQEFLFDYITSENQILQKGLSQNTVFAILQDRQGYLWFGTWDGLNKYDGYNFTIFNLDDGLSNETINTIIETTDGNLWIGTEYGLNCYHYKTGKFTSYLHHPDDSTTISDNFISYLYQDRPGRMIACTPKGLNVFDLETGKVKRYQSREASNRSTRSNFINCIFSDSTIYWTGSNFGLVKYNSKTMENIRFLNRPDDHQSLSNNNVRVIYQDRQHYLWIGTDNGLNLLDAANGTFTIFQHNPADPASVSANKISAVFEDSFGRFWVGTDGGGLNLFEKENGVFSRVQHSSQPGKRLNSDRIYSIYEDRTGNLWFGTFNGVQIIDRYAPKFSLYQSDPANVNSLASNYVGSFLEVSPNVFWIGTDNGISIFDKNKGSFGHIPYTTHSKNSLSGKRVRPILRDRYGNFWIGTRDSGLNKLETSTGFYHHFKPSIQDKNSICDNYIICLFEASDGLIWVGTQNGLNTIDPVTHKIKAYKNIPDDTASLANNTVYDIIADSQNTLWFATKNGLCRWNPELKNFVTYRKKNNNTENSSVNSLFCLYEDSENNFWLGSRGGGLVKFDKNTCGFTSFTMDNGLPNNVVYGILEDDEGNLWMSTNWGISKFNKTTNLFLNFDVTDGLQSNEFNAKSYLLSQAGEMFFGGMKGFNSFFPSEILTNPTPPNIVITAFKKFNIRQPVELFDGDTIRLRYDENFFSFEFSALDFTNPGKNKYAYKLENYNKDWTYVDGGRHFAEYTNVGPGSYLFRVTGSNNDGIWNDQGTRLTIIIRPPWFKTWYFRVGLLAGIIFMIWLIIVLRVSQIRKKHVFEKRMLNVEKQLFEIQQKALRLQMNPHFIFNSLNSIQSFILSKDIDLAVNYLSRFSQLMRLILANSRESIIPLADELQAVRYYIEIEQLRFDNKFNYSIQVDPEIDEEFTGIPPMILQPYVENAIIHGLLHKSSPGTISIEIKKNDSKILCIITDNGIGRARATEIKENSGLNNKSRGMLITRERLELLNKSTTEKHSVTVTDLFDQNGAPAGTRVELTMSLQEI